MAKTENKNETTGAVETVKEPKEKMVKVKIPRLRGESEDIFVSVNLRKWQIKRGVEVEVPECVAEVLRNSETALEKAFEYEDENKNG